MAKDAKSAWSPAAAGMIGAATVRRLRDMGCAVLAVDRIEPASEDGVIPFLADVTDPKGIEAVAAEAARRFGHAEALVHIAGGAGPDSGAKPRDHRAFRLATGDDPQCHQRFSALAGLWCRRCGRPRFGRVVLLSSSILAKGEKGAPTTVIARLPYATAKAALLGFGAQLAKDCASEGVTVNCVAPGLILGEPGTRIRDRFEALAETERQRMLAAIPAGRPGTADEVASIIAFLLTGAAGYINGATIAADGGAS